MDSDTIWRTIDEQRGLLADLLDTLDPPQWATPSLCTDWTVRDVAVHITHSHASPTDLARAALKSGFRIDSMIHRMAVADNADPAAITARLRAMAGSRQHPPLTKEVDPLLDILVHTQDICVPLGIERPMPTDAAVAVAERLWQMKFPLSPRRDLPGYRFVATDAGFAAGPQWGALREAPIRDIVMMFARRLDVPDSEPDADSDD
ncbi:maleylpyruvate isomerase family mycothiol-dependent enzyme [Mycobacterium sp. 21AC1]|uniref:maleylpyruvate isomerase family mycothiol-dependent enzyme n=1 Tax=[Mycobacterium] appelbergii TaxID=2939269 RepID=UPI0029391973|nr:maleylpyruvate isomerase family mycothiol-dependent enzyme [Mycobacterium sp. 21AC1]MDV3129577.1 maleylpyruvate isomerase family mycothiol-dependent enzyme [Mycobacterium sp. 21AC1]